MMLRRRCLHASALVLIVASPLLSQDAPGNPFVTSTIDSSAIRRLPIVRNTEVPSFLPRTSIRLDYDTHVRGAVSETEVRVDGIPVTNFTFGGSRISLAPHMLDAVRLWSDGAPVDFRSASIIEYETAPGDARWSGLLRAGTDAGLTGSIGNVRVNGAAAGSVGPLLLRATLHAQSAQETEFNNAPGVTFYRPSGIDTTVTIAGIGMLREVGVPDYEVFDGLPGTNWDDMAVTARLDWAPDASRTRAFSLLHFNRLQELIYPGVHLFNPGAQAARHNRGLLMALGVEHQLNATSSISVRIARSTDERTSGVLAAGEAGALRARDVGLSFGDYEFLVDSDRHPVTEAMIAALRVNNTLAITPFFARNDLTAATEFRLNPFAAYDFTTIGITSTGYAFDREHRTFLSGQWNGRFGDHTVSGGAEASFIESEGLAIGYTFSFGTEIWQEQPALYALFAQDAFTLGDASVSLGLRFDMFDNGAEYGTIPAFLAAEAGAFTPKLSTALSPRLAVMFPLPSGHLHVSFGRSAQPARLHEQYATMHTDFLRFRNAPSNTVFSRPLDLVEATHIAAAASLALNNRWELLASGFWNRSTDGATPERITIDDPTNPGVPQLLYIIASRETRELAGADVGTRYRLNERNFAEFSATYEDRSVELGPNVLGDADRKSWALTGLAQLGGLRASPGLDVTLTLRAHSIDQPELPDDFPAQPDLSWITRLDTRVAYGINIGSLRGALWAKLLRLAGSDPYVELLSARDRNIYITNARRVLGGNQSNDALPLGSLAETGDGILNEVDLAAIRAAEARFGNGDLIFTAEEQERAFGAAADLLAVQADQLSQQRRLELGIELSF